MSRLIIQHNVNLSRHNTMSLACIAKKVITINHITQLPLLPKADEFFILSLGSNVLLPTLLHTTVIRPLIQGITLIHENQDEVIVQVSAGENWHNFVMYCMQRGWYGLENLALIPSLVGASPIQNIGAYGVELKDRLINVETFDLRQHTSSTWSNSDCRFGYRDSIFKHTHQHHLITHVTFKLHKNPYHINTSYGDLHHTAYELAKGTPINAHHICQAVVNIRQSKLPDPALLPNCGSFFHNPIMTNEAFCALKDQFPHVPSYRVTSDTTKVPAAWLIDQAGLKGKGVAPIITYHKQALVLTNHAPQVATQADVFKAEQLISDTVFAKFGVRLQREPIWVNGE